MPLLLSYKVYSEDKSSRVNIYLKASMFILIVLANMIGPNFEI